MCYMEYVSFRAGKELLKQVDRGIKEFNYSTKSDFFRDAIREKLTKLQEERRKQELIRNLTKFKGIAKKDIQTTDEEMRQIKEEIADKIFADFEKRENERTTNQRQPLQVLKQQ